MVAVCGHSTQQLPTRAISSHIPLLAMEQYVYYIPEIREPSIYSQSFLVQSSTIQYFVAILTSIAFIFIPVNNSQIF